MFALQIPVWEKVLRTVIVYAAIVVLLRLAGKRGLAQLNTLDFVVLFLLSNVVQNAIIGNDNSVIGGLIGAVTLVVVDSALDRLIVVSPGAARLFEGTPTTVIENGQVLRSALRRLGIRPAELDQAVRLQNGDDLAQVEDGRLAPGGHLVLTLKQQEQGATKADVHDLRDQLVTVQAMLARLVDPPPRP
jgi:uncharacterized membrane protein YcaP (DUF421 family)